MNGINTAGKTIQECLRTCDTHRKIDSQNIINYSVMNFKRNSNACGKKKEEQHIITEKNRLETGNKSRCTPEKKPKKTEKS